MACAQPCATEHLRKQWADLVTHMRNHDEIIDNLYQRKVFNYHDVDSFQAEKTGCEKARYILDRVTKKGEEASYKLLRILDVTKKRTLHPDFHYWITCFPFREEDAEISYSPGE